MNGTGKALTYSVSSITQSSDGQWEINFSDGVTLFCAQKRDEAHIDQMVADAMTANAEQGARFQMMIAAVRAHEASKDQNAHA